MSHGTLSRGVRGVDAAVRWIQRNVARSVSVVHHQGRVHVRAHGRECAAACHILTPATSCLALPASSAPRCRWKPARTYELHHL